MDQGQRKADNRTTIKGTLTPSTPPRWKNNEYMSSHDVAEKIGIDVFTVNAKEQLHPLKLLLVLFV